jgi:hypothetical protein
MYTLNFWLYLALIVAGTWFLVISASLGVNEVAEWVAVAVEPYVP